MDGKKYKECNGVGIDQWLILSIDTNKEVTITTDKDKIIAECHDIFLKVNDTNVSEMKKKIIELTSSLTTENKTTLYNDLREIHSYGNRYYSEQRELLNKIDPMSIRKSSMFDNEEDQKVTSNTSMYVSSDFIINTKDKTLQLNTFVDFKNYISTDGQMMPDEYFGSPETTFEDLTKYMVMTYVPEEYLLSSLKDNIECEKLKEHAPDLGSVNIIFCKTIASNKGIYQSYLDKELVVTASIKVNKFKLFQYSQTYGYISTREEYLGHTWIIDTPCSQTVADCIAKLFSKGSMYIPKKITNATDMIDFGIIYGYMGLDMKESENNSYASDEEQESWRTTLLDGLDSVKETIADSGKRLLERDDSSDEF